MASTACELIWLKRLLLNLQGSSKGRTSLVCNNQVVMHIAANLVFHEITKHIEVDCYLIRAQV